MSLFCFHARFCNILCILLFLININVYEATPNDSQREDAAKNLIKNVFHGDVDAREWRKSDTQEPNNHWNYERWECKRVYCTDNAYDCWHIIIHVHPKIYRRWDKIYAYSYRDDALFLGREEFISKSRDSATKDKWGDYDIVKEENIERPSCHKFCHYYKFQHNDEVVIDHVGGNGKHLRVEPNNEGNLDHSGGVGDYAIWNTELTSCNRDGQNKPAIKIKSRKSGKYIRIYPDGNNYVINVLGTGGAHTVFIIHPQTAENTVKLESCEHKGKYLCTNAGTNTEHVGGGYGWCPVIFQSQSA